jgi:hypothetical protein
MNPNDSLTTRPSALRRLRAGLIGGLCSLCLVLLAGQAWATPCDLDQDGDVDLDDITQLQRILPSRPTASGPDDPRDPDRNGRHHGDVRHRVLRCATRCARISPTPPTVSLTAPVADALPHTGDDHAGGGCQQRGAGDPGRVLADATVIATVGNSLYGRLAERRGRDLPAERATDRPARRRPAARAGSLSTAWHAADGRSHRSTARPICQRP